MMPHYLGYVCGMRIACKKLQRPPSLIYPIVSDDEKKFCSFNTSSVLELWDAMWPGLNVNKLVSLDINTPTK